MPPWRSCSKSPCRGEGEREGRQERLRYMGVPDFFLPDSTPSCVPAGIITMGTERIALRGLVLCRRYTRFQVFGSRIRCKLIHTYWYPLTWLTYRRYVYNSTAVSPAAIHTLVQLQCFLVHMSTYMSVCSTSGAMPSSDMILSHSRALSPSPTLEHAAIAPV